MECIRAGRGPAPLAEEVLSVKPMDKHNCPICGNFLAESSSVCLHCAARSASHWCHTI